MQAEDFAAYSSRPAPWDRLAHEGETAVAFAHFCQYRDAGPTRQLRDTYRQAVGKPEARQASGQWLTWYTRFRWRQRAEAWDAEQERIRQEAAHQEMAVIGREATRQQYELAPQRTLQQAAALAFTNLADVAEWNNDTLRLKPSSELSPEARAAVRKVRIYKDKNGETVREIELHPKTTDPLALLAKHQKLIGDKETEAEVTQRNSFLAFINIIQSGEADELLERLTGVKLPPPPGKQVVEVTPNGPRKARD
jgi:hypothetical protein